MTAQKRRGFTLLELLSALTIATVLGLLSVAGINSLLQNSMHTNVLQTIITTLDRARSLAVIRGDRISICTTREMTACDTRWKGKNLLVFVNTDRDGEHDPDEEVVYLQPLETGVQVAWSGALHNPVISYQPDGSTVANGRLDIHDEKDSQWRKTIFISKPGRTRIE